MVADDEERVAVVGELPDQRFARPIEGFGEHRITGIGLDASRAEGQMRRGRVPCASVVTTATSLVAVPSRQTPARDRCGTGSPPGYCRRALPHPCRLAGRCRRSDRTTPRHRIDRSPGSGDGIDQQIRGHRGIDDAVATGGTGVVLHLLQHDQIRRAQVGDDDRRQPGEGVIRRIGIDIGRIEVLDVEGGHGQLIGPGRCGDSGCSVEGASVNGAVGTTSKLPKL